MDETPHYVQRMNEGPSVPAMETFR
jgi:hypothetical protein